MYQTVPQFIFAIVMIQEVRRRERRGLGFGACGEMDDALEARVKDALEPYDSRVFVDIPRNICLPPRTSVVAKLCWARVTFDDALDSRIFQDLEAWRVELEDVDPCAAKALRGIIQDPHAATTLHIYSLGRSSHALMLCGRDALHAFFNDTLVSLPFGPPASETLTSEISASPPAPTTLMTVCCDAALMLEMVLFGALLLELGVNSSVVEKMVEVWDCETAASARDIQGSMCNLMRDARATICRHLEYANAYFDSHGGGGGGGSGGGEDQTQRPAKRVRLEDRSATKEPAAAAAMDDPKRPKPTPSWRWTQKADVALAEICALAGCSYACLVVVP